MKRTFTIIGFISCICVAICCFSSMKRTYPNPIQTTKSKSDNQKTTDLEPVSNMTYEMSIYTQSQNENSLVKIQYPFFIWESKNKAVEVNRLILNKMREIATLDPGYFPENPKSIADYQSSVTLQNSKIISIVFWGYSDIEVSQHPTTDLYTLNIDLETLKEITLPDLYSTNEQFEKVFFEKAFFPQDPITSFSKEQFSKMLLYQTPEYTSTSPFYSSEFIDVFLKPEGIVFSLPSVHAEGYDHFEAEVLYSDIQEFYLPEKIYWK